MNLGAKLQKNIGKVCKNNKKVVTLHRIFKMHNILFNQLLSF